jgi:hypothetical protein
MSPSQRRHVEAIATEMTTGIDDIMRSLGLHQRDRSEVATIVQERRPKR